MRITEREAELDGVNVPAHAAVCAGYVLICLDNCERVLTEERGVDYSILGAVSNVPVGANGLNLLAALADGYLQTALDNIASDDFGPRADLLRRVRECETYIKDRDVRLVVAAHLRADFECLSETDEYVQ